jgi:UDP-glucose 4-epimerase
MRNDNKCILILGGNGFLGRNVVDYFNIHLRKQYNYTKPFLILGNQTVVNDLETICVELDYSDTTSLKTVFEKYPIGEVFHFISTSVPATSNNNIIKDVQSNLIATLGLLDLMAEYGVQKITYLSSGGTVYGEKHKSLFQEEELSVPNNSYGVLKLTIENYIHLYHKLKGINYLILRISNPFGKFHYSEVNGIINIAIRKSLKGLPIQIWGDGTAEKDYVFAEDFARVFWELNMQEEWNTTYNVGSGAFYSINEILACIKTVLPDTNWEYVEEKSFDTKHTAFKIDKLLSKMTFENTPLMEAIKQTCNWEKSNIKTNSNK